MCARICVLVIVQRLPDVLCLRSICSSHLKQYSTVLSRLIRRLKLCVHGVPEMPSSSPPQRASCLVPLLEADSMSSTPCSGAPFRALWRILSVLGETRLEETISAGCMWHLRGTPPKRLRWSLPPSPMPRSVSPTCTEMLVHATPGLILDNSQSFAGCHSCWEKLG